MCISFEQIKKTLAQKAQAEGIDEYEIFYMKYRDIDYQVKDGLVEETAVSQLQGVGLRIIKNERLGHSYGADFSEVGLDRLLQKSLRLASYQEAEEGLALLSIPQTYQNLDFYDPLLAGISLDEKLALARQVEEHLYALDARIKKVDRTGFSEGESEVALYNSYGIAGEMHKSFAGLYGIALSEADGQQESGYAGELCLRYSELDPLAIAQRAVKRAVRLLGAGNNPGFRGDVVFEPAAMLTILQIIGAGFSGENMYKEKSPFSQKLGQIIASDKVTIIDDGTLPGKIGTSSFDAEGVAAQRTVLVDAGRYETPLYDVKYAHKVGAQPTGNGIRGSYKGLPSIGTTNYYMAAGDTPAEEIIASTEKGLYLTEILGAHTANPITGEFSFGAAGILLEDGKMSRPVRGLTIAGNMRDLLQNVSAVGTDLTFYGSKGAPTVKIAHIDISGK